MRIFSLLPFDDKMHCVSQVCKGWRSLRREPTLWEKMAVTGADAYNSKNKTRFSDAGLKAFLLGPRSVLSSLGSVTDLSISGEKTIMANTFKASQAVCCPRPPAPSQTVAPHPMPPPARCPRPSSRRRPA